MQKTIFHIDLDAFFATCEEIINPKLRNKAFVVSGRNKWSVISCASYPARKYGIKAGLPVYLEMKKKPNLIIVPGHYELYDEMSRKFFKFIKTNYSNICEEMSIDECFVDVSKNLKHYKNNSYLLAKHMQNDIKNKLGLSCSIGISYNKFLAKMATDMNKPFGITKIMSKNDIRNKIWPLQIEQMFMIGKSTAPKLKKIGINTIHDLAKYEDYEKLYNIFFDSWLEMINLANGHGSDIVDISKNEPQSQSISHSLLEETNDISEIEVYFKHMASELATKLSSHNMACYTIGVTYKIEKNTFILSKKLNKSIYSYEDIYEQALKLFSNKYDFNKKVKLLGISASKLVNINQSCLSNITLKCKKNKLENIVENINKKIGKDLVCICYDKFNF